MKKTKYTVYHYNIILLNTAKKGNNVKPNLLSTVYLYVTLKEASASQ